MTASYATQIVESFRASVLERILVVDDAYEPPELEEDGAGDLVEVLERSDLRDQLSEELLGEEDRQAALRSLAANDLDDEAIAKARSSLYSTYVETRSPVVDPGGEFEGLKGAALEALDPLTQLLQRCTDRENIARVGTTDALRAYRDLKPDLILMDFYLSPPQRTARASTKGQSDGDRARSIRSLESMLSAGADATPAVVLMSSEQVATLAQAYRRRLRGRVTALRFGFLNKSWVGGSGSELSASGDAADVLMDASGSLEFGRVLESALGRWEAGARAGLERLYDELSDFDVKDFAYLLRFRLYEDGDRFADYLEWFLGESLRAIVDENVEWNAEDFRQLNERKLTEPIEGAHPIPSDRMATFFHRVRCNSREHRTRNRASLGDLFVAANGRDVRMVVTPDCDLMPRKKGPSAVRLLTVGGKIWGIEADQAHAGELIFRNGPRAIKWNYKDLMTHEFSDVSRVTVGETPYLYFGSLREMPAQMIQKMALADLSRVGLASPPPVDVGAPVTVFVKKDRGNEAPMVELEGLGEPRAQVLMPRGGSDKHKRALFTRKFVRELIARVEELNEDDLLGDQRQYRRDWIENLEGVRKAMLRDGLKLPGEGLCNTGVYIGSKKGRRWLEIVVNVSDEALIRLSATDPLAD